jgi:hypothetical protein
VLPLQQPLQPREAATVPVPRRPLGARPCPLALHPTPRGPSRPLSPRPWLAKGVLPRALRCRKVPGVQVVVALVGVTRPQPWCWLRRRTRASQVRCRCPLRCCFPSPSLQCPGQCCGSTAFERSLRSLLAPVASAAPADVTVELPAPESRRSQWCSVRPGRPGTCSLPSSAAAAAVCSTRWRWHQRLQWTARNKHCPDHRAAWYFVSSLFSRVFRPAGHVAVTVERTPLAARASWVGFHCDTGPIFH